MENTQARARRARRWTGTTLGLLLMAIAAVGGCEAHRGRLVTWRAATVTAPAGEPAGRGARAYRVALPPAAAGERPVRAELLFAEPLESARVDAIGVRGGARRPLLARRPARGDLVVVPLDGKPVEAMEVVLRGRATAAPTLRAARVATAVPVAWPDALGPVASEVVQ